MATGADYEVVDVGSGEEITNPGANDVMVAFHKSTGALEKIDYNKLAKAIIEQYTGSTIGGAAQSVQSAFKNIGVPPMPLATIPQNTDLNNVFWGSYQCNTSALNNTIINKPSVPSTHTVWRLDVLRITRDGAGSYDQLANWITGVQQLRFITDNSVYERKFNVDGNKYVTWGDWKKQPTRDEMDAVSVSTGINGLFAFKMGSIVWIRMYDCAYDITGTLPESLRPKSGVHFCAVSGSADRKVALVSINAAGKVDVNSQITSGYIYGGAVYMT